MQGKNNKSTDSVRNQSKQQRSGGSHFASGSAAPAKGKEKTSEKVAPAAQVRSVRLPQVAAESKRAMTGEQKKIAALDSAMIPRVAAKDDPNSTGARRALISGASGALPKIPNAKVARKVTAESKGYSRYSNGYFDRPDAKQITDVVSQFQTEPVEGAPAYSWLPFFLYGVVAAAACILWLVISLVSGAAPFNGNCPEATIGLVILGLTVLGGIVTAVVTSILTIKQDKFQKMDVWASALGKSSIMLFAALLVWIVCSAILN